MQSSTVFRVMVLHEERRIDGRRSGTPRWRLPSGPCRRPSNQYSGVV